MKSLLQIYQEHTGNVSDKWGLYLAEYDRLFSAYRDSAINLLEIGVQNGGSLGIWGKYFEKAKAIIGCDINPDCAKLRYADTRIAVVVGDANTDQSEVEILSHADGFDLIIDDGSHKSGDIVRTFERYFRHVSDGGLFIAEDLHCSYWREFDGGLYDPYSSISFFKQLADVINYEHWGVDKEPGEVLNAFYKHFNFIIDNELLSHIHSIEFINSLCIVRKSPASENLLGSRYIVGDDEIAHIKGVAPLSTKQATLSQLNNPWSARAFHPMDEIAQQRAQIAEQTTQLASHAQELTTLRQANSDQDKKIRQLTEQVAQQELQAKNHHQEMGNLSAEIDAILHSRSWRITAPLRWPFHRARALKRILHRAKSGIQRCGGGKNALKKTWEIYRSEGFCSLKHKLKNSYHQESTLFSPQAVDFLPKITKLSTESLPLRILIIAELSIPQCSKYRVAQKSEMLTRLKIPHSIHNWTHTDSCFNALSTHSIVIFYRTPAVPSVLQLLAEAQRLKMRTIWEVDDLIFDRDLLAKREALQKLDQSVFNGLLQGADLYRKMMLSCNQAIASTSGLAKAMHSAGMAEVFVVENALDAETLDIAQKILAQRNINSAAGVGESQIRIVYGSGTSTHDSDFEIASSAIGRILDNYPNIRLRIIGTLDIPRELHRFLDRIERIPFCSYQEYLKFLSESDINIAPLENDEFNDAKSNIKFIEASIVKIPSVCSPRAAFRLVIQNGINGYLADEVSDSWFKALQSLVQDKALRQKMGETAYEKVMEAYTPENIANVQIKPLFENHNRPDTHKRVLSVNIYYAPRSYGGATIVAEEINRILNSNDNTFSIYAFTTLPTDMVPAYVIRRYEHRGVPVFAVGLPEALDPRTQFENQHMVKPFLEVLEMVKPDLVHFHSVQGIGVSVIDACKDKRIPYLITLHDAWWLCGRQFMVNKHNKFCGQTRIDLSVCAKCVDDSDLNAIRQKKLKETLDNATLLISPSEYFADFYAQNGVSKDRLRINKNGIKPPIIKTKLRRPGPLTFAYVGGKTDVKGYSVVREAFAGLSDREDVKLIIVDNTHNLGFSSYAFDDVGSSTNVELVPAYTQDTIDDFFSGIDVLLFPTRAKESFGLVVREALARNVWVISTNSGGPIEDIISGSNGIIIPLESSTEDVIAAILDTIKHYTLFDIGSEIDLETRNITTFKDQSTQLALIFNEALEAAIDW